MSHPHPKGLWIRVHDRESALYTVRGSGFPTFLIGFVGAVGALMIAGPETALLSGGMAVLSLALIGLGYFIRSGAGHPALIPLVWLCILALLAIEFTRAAGILILAQLIFAGLAASGIRGWAWLRRR